MRLKSISLAILLSFLPQGVAGKAPTSGVLIRDVRVFDGEKVIEHRSVPIENGRISRISGPELKADSAEIIDGRGRTRVVSGLVHPLVRWSPDGRKLLYTTGNNSGVDAWVVDIDGTHRRRVLHREPIEGIAWRPGFG